MKRLVPDKNMQRNPAPSLNTGIFPENPWQILKRYYNIPVFLNGMKIITIFKDCVQGVHSLQEVPYGSFFTQPTRRREAREGSGLPDLDPQMGEM
jgi:hypothetical protein